YFSLTRVETAQFFTLSLHDALPIYERDPVRPHPGAGEAARGRAGGRVEGLHPAAGQGHRRGDRRGGLALDRHPGVEDARGRARRSEEHTSELQSREKLVCRLLLEKK